MATRTVVQESAVITNSSPNVVYPAVFDSTALTGEAYSVGNRAGKSLIRGRLLGNAEGAARISRYKALP